MPERSGIPTGWPCAFGQVSRSATLLRKSASVPTSAKSSLHALMTALRASFALSLESMKSTTTLRPAMPPSWLTVGAHAFTASAPDLKRPGTTGLSTSATTAMRISESVIPTSLAFGFCCAPAGTSATPMKVATTTTAAGTARAIRMSFPRMRISIKYFLVPPKACLRDLHLSTQPHLPLI